MFEKTPEVAPLLVRLYDSHKLYGLVKDDKPLAKAELTSAVADLLETDLNPREQELLADVLIGLMRQAEKDLRLALSERLATLKNVPLRLVLHLANDEIQVAEPVLRKSIILSDLDLIYIIKSQGADYWQAIANRESLSNEVIDILAETRDFGVAVALGENERITLTSYAISILAEMGQRHDEVARPLIMRNEVPETVVRELYQYVGQQLKDYINTFYGLDKNTRKAVDENLDDLIIEFAEPEVEEVLPYMPSDKMIAAAEKYAAMGMLNSQFMMNVLERGQIASFIALFAKYSGMSPRRVHESLCRPQPKGIVIACRAYGVQKSDFSKIYLMTHAMRSNQRIVDHKDMLEVLKYFDKVRPEVARRIVEQSDV